MSRKGENIYKRKDGRWEGRYQKGRRDDGRISYGSVYARSYLDVKKKLQIAMCTPPIPKTTADQTFGAVTEQWLLGIRTQIKESSYVKYVNLIDNHILPYLGEIPLSKLTTETLEVFITQQIMNGKKQDGQPLASKTVKDIFSIIKLILAWADRQQYTIVCHTDAIRIRSREKEIHILNKKEQHCLENFLIAQDDNICMGILMSLYTGIRIGEICALRWKNILLDEGLLQVRATLQRISNMDSEEKKSAKAKTKVIITPPKSSCSNRDIPLPRFLLQRLQQMECKSQDAFFLTGSTNRWVEPRLMNYQFKRILRICDIPVTNFHTLRHTFATRCIEKQFDVKTLSEILGHSNVNITLNRYVHISMEQKRQHMERLEMEALPEEMYS